MIVICLKNNATIVRYRYVAANLTGSTQLLRARAQCDGIHKLALKANKDRTTIYIRLGIALAW